MDERRQAEEILRRREVLVDPSDNRTPEEIVLALGLVASLEVSPVADDANSELAPVIPIRKSQRGTYFVRSDHGR